MRASLIILSCSLSAITTMPVYAQNAQSVRLGEAALTFASGSIRQDMPFEGVVNVITGDNQLSGNRMMIGWTGTDTLYLRLKNPGDAALGDLYTVYRRSRKVFHPITRQYLGYIINRLGVVQVIQLDPAVVGVRVVRSYAPFSPGDPVMRFTPPTVEVVDTVSSSGEVEAMVVDLQSDKNMSLVAQGNLVYLDKGQGDGLRVGDFLEVFRTGGGLPERRIGEVKILSTEPNTATAVLSKTTARVLIGDRLRAKRASHIEAMLSQSGDFDFPAAIVRPVVAEKVGTVLPPPSEPRALSKAQIERVHRVTKINFDDLADQLEYESGEVKVKPSAVPILEQLTDYLKITAMHQQVRVEGHSDNMEIGPTLKGQFPTNWELSKARAAYIVRYLIEKGGMDSAKLSAVGYGASRPVASNATDDGREKNRRIEVILESPEDRPSAQPVKRPAGDGHPKSAELSVNDIAVAPSDASPVVSAPGTPIGPTSSEAASDHETPPAEMTAPATPSGGESALITPGL
ncbi:MAG: OmpA family protein [Nitrospirota bacterium]|nr:OmpA family protein [Nitrospirota bacterium]